VFQKRHLCALLSLSIVVLLALPASARTTNRAAAFAAPPQKAQVPVRPARTPMERLMLPYLGKRMAARSPQSLSRRLNAADAPSIPSSNFGGYLTAPYFPARQESSCITDPYNCGVTSSVSADFDNDGKQDIAVFQADGTLNILLNQGGSFAAPVSYANPNYSSTFIEEAFAVDLNQDGYADLLALDGESNALIVFMNQKNGTFGSAQSISLSFDYGGVNTVAMGDVNGDGKLDIVAVSTNITGPGKTDVTVQTLVGNGDGTFQNATNALTNTVHIPHQVQFNAWLGITLGDLNGDGKLDLAAAFENKDSNYSGSLVASVALGHGDGTFDNLGVTNPISIPLSSIFPLQINTAGVQLVDLNKDSHLDLAVDTNGTLYVALGDGHGGFTSVAQTPNVSGPAELVYADVTGDGILDAVLDDGLLQIWPGKGDGTFTAAVTGTSYIIDSAGAQDLNIADFDGDGKLDIAQLGGDYKQLSLFTGNGQGGFRGAPALGSTTDSVVIPWYLSLEGSADVNGDGNTDLLFIDGVPSTPNLVTGLSDGKGNFTYKTALSSSVLSAFGFLQPVSADFNGDGKQDALLAGTKGLLAVALSKGDGTFLAPVSLAMPKLNCELNYAATGDLNGDGATDIVVAYPGDAACGGTGSTPSGYVVLLGKGDGTFSAPTFTPYGGELYAITIADVNGDGHADLLLDDAPFDGAGSFAVDLVVGNGDGTFAGGGTVVSDYLVSQVLVGDMNRDGKPDLILLSEGEQTDQDAETTAGILYLPGRGDGTFQGMTQIGTGNFFLNGTIADINNDGIPDLTAALYTSVGQPNTYFGLSTMLGKGDGSFASPVNALENMDSALPIAGNFLTDNAPDIAVQTSAGTAIYLGQGGSAISATASAASLNFGDAETISVTLTPSMSGRPAPTGNVSFYDGATLLGSAGLSGNSASFATSQLAVGTHTITAVYAGDGNYNPNTAAGIGVTVTTLPAAFSLTAGTSSVSLSRGQNGAVALTLAANASFSGAVNLSCSGLPSKATCLVNPTSVTLAQGGSATATLVIGTTSGKAANQAPGLPWQRGAGGTASLALAAVIVMGRRRRAALRKWMSLAVLLAGAGAMMLSGCGGDSTPTAAKGSYTVKVTATPGGSGAAPQTATVQVTID
jgi:hypothetical protein